LITILLALLQCLLWIERVSLKKIKARFALRLGMLPAVFAKFFGRRACFIKQLLLFFIQAHAIDEITTNYAVAGNDETSPLHVGMPMTPHTFVATLKLMTLLRMKTILAMMVG